MSSVGKARRALVTIGVASLTAQLLACPATMVLPITPTIDPLAESHPGGCVVERWEDGGTAYVDCGSDQAELVRLVGIDTAELGFDAQSRERARWQAALWKLPYEKILACGKAATARVKEICPEGSEVVLHGDETDKFDRLLAHVHCGGKNVNQRMMEEGHAGRYAYPADPERPRLCR